MGAFSLKLLLLFSGEGRMERLVETAPVSAELAARVVPAFERAYDHAPEFVVRAPGRVNIIGEHIDYSGFAVLPFALAQDIAIAGAADCSNATVRVVNCDGAYGDEVCEFSASDPSFDESKKHWTNFVRCGFLAVMELAQKKAHPVSAWAGACLAVHGTVPAGAGLSSSSALVVASALACVRANNLIGFASPVCASLVFCLTTKLTSHCTRTHRRNLQVRVHWQSSMLALQVAGLCFFSFFFLRT